MVRRVSPRSARVTTALEALFAAVADGIREVAVQRELRVLYLRVDREVESLARVAAGSDALEGRVELGEVLHLDHEMELAERRDAEAELSSGQPPGLDRP